MDALTLEYVGHEFYNFKDHSYRWVCVKNFAVPTESTDPAILAMLLVHPRYRDNYIGPPAAELEWPVHGPYRLEAIEVADYVPVSVADGLGAIDGFVELYGGAPENVRDALVTAVHPLISGARARYLLRDLTSNAWHDVGFILTDFNEVVAISPDGHTLAQIVTGCD